MGAARENPLTIVIPVLNEASNLPGLGESLRKLDAEVIVVDGGSADGSVESARQWAHQVLIGEPGRAAQMNVGARAAKGDYLLFLHADTRLPATLEGFLRALVRRRPAWGFFRLSLHPKGMPLSCVESLINLRSRLTSVATGDQAIFVRRDIFEQLQGYASIPLMEDVELSKRLRRRERPLFWPEPVTTSSRRWYKHGVLRTILLMWRLRLLYALGVSPNFLHKQYYGKP